MLTKFRSLDGWTKVVVFFLFGPLFMGKASAYVELAFGGLLLLSTRVLWDRWYLGLTRRNDVLNELSWPLLISLIYGFAQLIYGLFQGYSVLTAFQVLVFSVCPVYLFLGIWSGYRHPGLVRTYIRYMAWFSVIFTPLYFLVLQKLTMPGADPNSSFSAIGGPATGSPMLLGLISYEPNLAKFWLPILMLTGLTIAYQERADWLGLGMALIVWGKLSKKIGRVFTLLGVLATFLLIAALIDLKLPPIPGRGGELSARGTIARMAGSISPQWAADIEGDRADANFYYGTVYWRKRWWAGIREEVTKDPQTLIFGLGYGYPLAKLSGNPGTVQEGTRSPHSIFYFTLAYSGIVGVVIFFWLEICVARLLYRAYKVTGETYGLTYYVYSIVGAFFGNFLETPAAIMFYLLLGLCIGPMFLRLDLENSGEYSELGVPLEVGEVV
jgi:hypothetical protein